MRIYSVPYTSLDIVISTSHSSHMPCLQLNSDYRVLLNSLCLFFLVDSSVFHFHCFYLSSISILIAPLRPSWASHWTQCKILSLCMAQEDLLVILSTITVPCVQAIKIAVFSMFQVHSSFGAFTNVFFFIRNDPTSCLIFTPQKIKSLFTSSSWGRCSHSSLNGQLLYRRCYMVTIDVTFFLVRLCGLCGQLFIYLRIETHMAYLVVIC